MEKKYNIVFKGKLVLGYHIQDVRNELAAKFKLDNMALGKLFSKDPQILKKAVDLDTAQKFLQMMEKIGARCEMEVFDPALKAAQRPAESMNQATDGPFTCPKCGFKQKKSDDNKPAKKKAKKAKTAKTAKTIKRKKQLAIYGGKTRRSR